jgi:hypothetical protein
MAEVRVYNSMIEHGEHGFENTLSNGDTDG